MSCCKDPYLMDDEDECGCIMEVCFHCNDYRIVRWCSLHNPEGGEPEWYLDLILLTSDWITHALCVNSHIVTVGVGDETCLANLLLRQMLLPWHFSSEKEGLHLLLFVSESLSKTDACLRLYVLNEFYSLFFVWFHWSNDLYESFTLLRVSKKSRRCTICLSTVSICQNWTNWVIL